MNNQEQKCCKKCNGRHRNTMYPMIGVCPCHQSNPTTKESESWETRLKEDSPAWYDELVDNPSRLYYLRNLFSNQLDLAVKQERERVHKVLEYIPKPTRLYEIEPFIEVIKNLIKNNI